MTEQSKREKADKAIEIINAWADGVPIQYRNPDDRDEGWKDYSWPDLFPDNSHWEFRIKPKTRYILHFDNLSEEAAVIGYVFRTGDSARDVMMVSPGVYSHIEEIPNE